MSLTLQHITVFTPGRGNRSLKGISSHFSAGLQAGKLKLPLPDGCPSKIYKLMVRCWALSLKERPSFTDIVHALGELPSDSKVWSDQSSHSRKELLPTLPHPPSPKIQTGMLDYLVSHISGKRVEGEEKRKKKTLIFYAFQQFFECGLDLFAIWVELHSPLYEWLRASSARSLPSPQYGRSSPTSSLRLWFHCDPARLRPFSFHGASQPQCLCPFTHTHTHSLSL